MAETDEITISAEPRRAIKLTLVGKEYSLKAPKGSSAIVIAKQMAGIKETDDPEKILRGLKDWLTLAVGRTESTAIMKRLDDPEDDLDLVHLTELMKQVTERTVPGNPTT